MTFAVRPPTDADLPRLVEIAQASSREIATEPTTTADDIRADWRAPHFDLARHAIVVQRGDEIAASATLWVEGDQAHGGGYVMPEHRGHGIGTTVLQWALDAARAEPDVERFYTWASLDMPDAIALVESFPGSEHARSFFRMRNDRPADVAEPVWPDGTELRPLRGEELVAAIVEAHDGSFVDHWNFTPIEPDEVRHWLEYPGFDPALVFVAFAGDAIAGFCVNHLMVGAGFVRAQLGPIGTTRPFRGIGLGRALLRHSVRACAAAGVTEVTLGVDTQNPNGAVRLYTSNGFVQTHEGRAYQIKL
jgi:mycothiol synthase